MEQQGFGVGTPAVSGMEPSGDAEYLRNQYRMSMATHIGAYIFLLLLLVPKALQTMGLEHLVSLALYGLIAAGFGLMLFVAFSFFAILRQELREDES